MPNTVPIIKDTLIGAECVRLNPDGKTSRTGLAEQHIQEFTRTLRRHLDLGDYDDGTTLGHVTLDDESTVTDIDLVEEIKNDDSLRQKLVC